MKPQIIKFNLTFKSFLGSFFILFLLLSLESPVNGQEKVPQLTKLARWDNPDLPTISGGQKFNEIWGWTSPEGKEYVILGSNDSTYFFDISRPDNPVIVDIKAGASKGVVHRDYAIQGHYCYAVNDDKIGSLQIFDLQYLPDSVEKIYDTFSFQENFGMMTHNVFSNNGKLYLASNRGIDSNGFYRHPMTVLSLDTPEKPELLSHLTASQLGLSDSIKSVHDVYVHNDTAYCSFEEQGMMIIDYQDAQNPELISHIKNYPQQGYNHSSWVTADRKTMVFADETHGKPLKVWDVNDHENPEFKALIGSNADKGSIPHNPIIKGNLVYTSYYHDGLQLFDISNPENPEHVAGYDTYPENGPEDYEGFRGCWGVYPFFESGTIAASDMQNGLFLFRLDTVESNSISSAKHDPETKIWPNPFESELKVTFEPAKNQDVNYALYDANGRQVVNGRKKVTKGTSSTIELNGLGNEPAGIYWLKLKTHNAVRHHKVLKTR